MVLRQGRAIIRGVRLRNLGNAEGSMFQSMAIPNLKRRVSNSWSAVRDTYLSTKQVFESHRVVFTVGTSVASVLTAWAGYSLRQHHQAKIDKRLNSIEQSLKNNYSMEHEEIKKIVTSGNVTTATCLATAWTTLIIGYGLGWRGGSWFAKRKFLREQQKLMGQIRQPRGWQILRKSFTRFRSKRSIKTAENTVESSPIAPSAAA